MQNNLNPGFTVAVLADIHGNLAAFEAALADLVKQEYDVLVLAGDMLMIGPQPSEVLELVRDLRVPTIYGNTERDVVDAGKEPSIERWTADQIGKEGIEYLDDLPFAHFETPDGAVPGTDLLIVHATPLSVFDTLILETHPLRPNLHVTPEAEAEMMVGDTQADLIVYGHIHYPSSGQVKGQRLASIGAVGLPFDGDRRAAYALVRWDGSHWQITHHRVEYDFERTIDALKRSGQPDSSRHIEILRQARWIPDPA